MKNSLFVLKLCFVCLLIMGAAHSAHATVMQMGGDGYNFAPDGPVSRTYSNKSNAPQPGDRNWRRKGSGNPSSQKTITDVVISYQDFQNHLAVGQDRLVRVLSLNGSTITMDVGAGGGVASQVWNMPDLSVYPSLQTVSHTSVPVTSAPNFDFFTSEDDNGNVTNPAAAYLLSTGSYQFLDFFVSEFEGEQSGTLNNLGYATSEEIYSFYIPQAPIPLSLAAFNQYAEIIGEPCIFFPGGCQTGNADEETFNLNQSFEIVASGIMNTYDGESSPGIKVHNTEVFTIFDSNGNEILTRTLRYVLWYTKAGHFVRAGLADGAPWTGSTNFDFFEYQKLTSSALPVEWLAVNAEVVKNSEVKVNWSTATETQNERFVVERSADGDWFTPIGGLDAVGDSDERQDYTYTDEAPLDGFNYYRIQQQDIDGQASYSAIVSALVTRTAADEELVVLYPNPGRNEVFFSRPADYQLLTVAGQLLAEGRAEQQMDVADLPAGTYLVRIDGGEAYRWVKR